MNSNLITHARLLELISFDADTGVFRWKVTKSSRAVAGQIAGNCSGGWYVQIEIDGRRYLGHRLALFYVSGRWPSGVVDHVNNVRTDNRVSNLREATKSLNAANSKLYSTNKSGFRGVSWSEKYKKWRVSIKVHGKSISLGRFSSLHEAASAYQSASEDAFGDFTARRGIEHE